MVQRIHKTIKVYLAGICLKYLESGFQDPINKTIASYSASYAKALSALREQQGAHVFLLPSIFSTQLKSKLREESSYSLLEKRLLWSDFKLAFHGFLRASEFATPDLSWSNIQLNNDKISVT